MRAVIGSAPAGPAHPRARVSNRTWACVACGKTYRRDQRLPGPVVCAICRNPCEYVHWKIRVPSPKKAREWNRFWRLYRSERRELERCFSDGNVEEVVLDLLNMRILPRLKRPGTPDGRR